MPMASESDRWPLPMRNCRRPFLCAARYTLTHKHTLPQSAYTATLPYLNSGSIAPTRTTGPMNVNADVAGWGAHALSLSCTRASKQTCRIPILLGLEEESQCICPRWCDGRILGKPEMVLNLPLWSWASLLTPYLLFGSECMRCVL